LDDICDEQESDSACVYGKISVLFMISVTNLHFSEIKGTGPTSQLLTTPQNSRFMHAMLNSPIFYLSSF